MFRTLFVPPPVSPFSNLPKERLGPWVASNASSNILPASLNAFIERLIVQRASFFGLRAFNRVDAANEPVRLSEVGDFEFVVSRWGWLFRFTGERIFIPFRVARPYYDRLERSRIAFSESAMSSWADAIWPISDLKFDAAFTAFHWGGPWILTPAYLLRIESQKTVPAPPARVSLPKSSFETPAY